MRSAGHPPFVVQAVRPAYRASDCLPTLVVGQLSVALVVSSHGIIASGVQLCQTRHVKVREVARRLQDDGWFWIRTRGSHHQFDIGPSADWFQCPAAWEMTLRPGR